MAAATFPLATAAEMQPMALHFNTAPNDAAEWLPAGAADRLRKLRQHVADLHALTVPFADISAATTARIQAEHRLTQLTGHPHDGGHGLAVDDPRVIAQQRLVDKLTDDLRRINERNEARSSAWREAGYTLQAVEAWPRDGKPPGTLP